jgi:hypothetical protein
MLRSGTARTATPDDARGQQSLGDLVGLALKDVSQLVRYEINLAKKEFKVDLTVSEDIDMLKRSGSSDGAETPAIAKGSAAEDRAPAAVTAKSLAR